MTPVEGSRTAIGDKCDGAGAQAARATGTASWVTVDTHAATAFGGRCACGAAGRWRARWWCRDVARATWLVRAWPWGPGLVPAFRWLCAPGGPLLALAYLIECDHRENARTIQLAGSRVTANASRLGKCGGAYNWKPRTICPVFGSSRRDGRGFELKSARIANLTHALFAGPCNQSRLRVASRSVDVVTSQSSMPTSTNSRRWLW